MNTKILTSYSLLIHTHIVYIIFVITITELIIKAEATANNLIESSYEANIVIALISKGGLFNIHRTWHNLDIIMMMI
jgi:hypothetical protein